MLKTRDFYYDLPTDLIAQFPEAQRSQSRLLYLSADGSEYQEHAFHDLMHLLRPHDLLILNNTKVIKSRLFGRKETGGKVEVFVERVLSESDALCMVRASRSPLINSEIILDSGIKVMVTSKEGAFFVLRFESGQSVSQILAAQGAMPLPPYIERSSRIEDDERYQTVFAEVEGAVAAPTAGLHFDKALLVQLQNKGIDHAFITLHVGAGTFQPIRTDNVASHQMHAERLEVDATVCAAIRTAKAKGGRIIGVGSTAVRALESASVDGMVQPFSGATQMYITPGYAFQAVDAMVTNFHLPESTLLVLVCALGGYERMMAAYQYAIEQRFRFFSYGDAMFIEKSKFVSSATLELTVSKGT